MTLMCSVELFIYNCGQLNWDLNELNSGIGSIDKLHDGPKGEGGNSRIGSIHKLYDGQKGEGVNWDPK